MKTLLTRTTSSEWKSISCGVSTRYLCLSYWTKTCSSIYRTITMKASACHWSEAIRSKSYKRSASWKSVKLSIVTWSRRTSLYVMRRQKDLKLWTLGLDARLVSKCTPMFSRGSTDRPRSCLEFHTLPKSTFGPLAASSLSCSQGSHSSLATASKSF